MKILENKGITFNDVLLVPQHTTLTTRMEADTSTSIGNLKLKIPILSSNMDTITGKQMALEMAKLGGAGVLHRYQPIEAVIESLILINEASPNNRPAIPSVGVKDLGKKCAEIYREFTDKICLDVAHGDSDDAWEMVRFLKTLNFNTIIAGNVATAAGAYGLIMAGANVIKVGIGPGSVCETRSVTGHGVPQLTAIKDVCFMAHALEKTVIADGGMNSAGDITKALGMGADAIMTGSLLAGTDECNKQGVYRGMASAEAQLDWRGGVSNGSPEGISQKVNRRGPVKNVIEQLVGGIRSGMSYSGVRTLAELRKKAIFMMVSSSTISENGTRKL